MNLQNLWNSIECYLLPHLEDLLDTELNKKECEFIQLCTLSNLGRHIFDLE